MDDRKKLKELFKSIGIGTHFNRIPEHMASFEGDKLVQLQIRNKNIEHLPDLDFPHLRSFSLESIPIRYLLKSTFVGTPKLEKLYIRNSNIRRLHEDLLIPLTELRVLMLANNKLIDIPTLNQCWRLESVNLKENKITDIAPSTFKNLLYLKKIDLTANKLTVLPKELVVECESLEELLMVNNSLVNIPLLNKNSRLMKFDAQYNKITEVSETAFTSNYELKYISLNSNKIKDINDNTFSNLSKLIRVNLSVNKIENLGMAFENCISLEWLELEYNVIRELPAKVFDDLRSLIKLNIQYNGLEILDDIIFSGLKKLTILLLSFNNLTRLPSSIKKLKLWELYLKGNELGIEVETIVGRDKIRAFLDIL